MSKKDLKDIIEDAKDGVLKKDNIKKVKEIKIEDSSCSCEELAAKIAVIEAKLAKIERGY